MSKLYVVYFSLVIASFLFAYRCLAKTALPTLVAPSSNPWSEKMQDMSKTISALIINTSSNERYRNPKNEKTIETELKSLSSLSHDLKMPNVSSVHPEASIQVMASRLGNDANDAYLAFQGGNREYARALSRSVMNSCIACHTLNGSGPHFPDLKLDTTGLNTIERARLFSATRQFDSAEGEYQKIINDSKLANNDSSTWTEAVNQSLIIAIRVKRDKQLALVIIDAVLAADDAPFYLRDEALYWKKSVQSWNPKKITTENALLADAKRLFTQAKDQQKYSSDHSTDMLYVIASSDLSDLLALAPDGPHASEALFMEGICNENMGATGFENLPLLFFKECILKKPHSLIAKECYLGFSGSSGTHLPNDVKTNLLHLQKLANPEN
jgi:mono/diheme cytochrome c family protein